MSKVEDAVAEIDQAIASMAPAHDGLRDYAELNLKPATLEAVGGALALYDERLSALTAARQALVALMENGFPALTIPDITITVQLDLEDSLRAITAALAQFMTNAATELGLAAAPPEAK